MTQKTLLKNMVSMHLFARLADNSAHRICMSIFSLLELRYKKSRKFIFFFFDNFRNIGDDNVQNFWLPDSPPIPS